MRKLKFRRRLGKKRLLLAIVPAAAVLLLGSGTFALLKLASNGGNIDLNTGLVGWWKFDGNANDSSGKGSNGTVNGATLTTGHTGVANTAYSFNGSTDYIGLTFNSSLQVNNGTVSSWTKATSPGSLYRGIIVNQGKYALYYRNGELVTYDFSTATVKLTGINIADGNWHNVAMTFRNGVTNGTTVYLDGAPVLTTTIGFTTGNAVVVAGAGNSSGSVQNLAGSIDDSRVYNRILSPQEVKAIYQDQTSSKASLKADAGNNGLVGWWKMDGNAKDATPYANNGTVTGATLTTDRKGAANSAYAFSGTSTSNIVAPNSSAYTFSTNNFSVSGWFKRNASATTFEGLIGKGGQIDTKPGYEIFTQNSNAVVLRLTWPGGGTNGTQLIKNGLNVSDGKWHYFAAVIDRSNSTAYLYIDNLPAATLDISSVGDISSTQTLRIGNAGAGYLDGALDDMRIYKRALSAAEVSSQYNSYNSQISLYKPSGGGGSGVNLTAGLIGWWPFNGNAKDNTPHQDNGTVTSATLTADRKGRANSAYAFNPVNFSIINASSSIFNLTNNFTLSAWLYANPDSNTNYSIISTNPYNTDGRDWWLHRQRSGLSNNLSFQVRGGSQIVSSTPIGSGAWYNVAFTLNGGVGKLYINGALSSTSSSFGSITAGNSAISIGRNTGAGTSTTDGTIDDVRIYNRPLSDAEIAALYNVYY
jgi:hypothetical protein